MVREAINKQINLIFRIASFLLRPATTPLKIFFSFMKNPSEIILQVSAERCLLYLKLYPIIGIINVCFYSAI